jgi:hypothetical protein
MSRIGCLGLTSFATPAAAAAPSRVYLFSIRLLAVEEIGLSFTPRSSPSLTNTDCMHNTYIRL